MYLVMPIPSSGDGDYREDRSAHIPVARGPRPATPGERLKDLRIRAGYQTVEEAALKLGVAYRDKSGELRGYSTYAQHESGHRMPTRAAERYARHFGVSPGYLLYGKVGEAQRIPVLGVIGVKGKVSKARARETLEAPRGEEGHAAEFGAFRIADADLWPFLREGDYVVYQTETFAKPPIPKTLDGRRCLVQLGDGTMGIYEFALQKNGSITLRSTQGGPIKNARVQRAAPVLWVNMTHNNR
jgi:transcriptional regulator with XRE-family HTH domain